MCLSLSLQQLSVLPGFGAQSLGDEPAGGGCSGADDAAVTQAGPVTVGRGGLAVLRSWGAAKLGLPHVLQHGQGVLLVPGLPHCWGAHCEWEITAHSWWDSRKHHCHGDKNSLEGQRVLPKSRGRQVYRP